MARATEALAGLGVAALLFAGARALLQDSARAEPFRVEVEAPARVVASSERLRQRRQSSIFSSTAPQSGQARAGRPSTSSSIASITR